MVKLHRFRSFFRECRAIPCVASRFPAFVCVFFQCFDALFRFLRILAILSVSRSFFFKHFQGCCFFVGFCVLARNSMAPPRKGTIGTQGVRGRGNRCFVVARHRRHWDMRGVWGRGGTRRAPGTGHARNEASESWGTGHWAHLVQQEVLVRGGHRGRSGRWTPGTWSWLQAPAPCNQQEKFQGFEAGAPGAQGTPDTWAGNLPFEASCLRIVCHLLRLP